MVLKATLGISEATNKTIVQCNVGNKSPVLLCVLLPNKTESCHLELEFEEADDVVFSVIGPRSVYLTGYYVVKSRQLSPHSDTYPSYFFKFLLAQNAIAGNVLQHLVNNLSIVITIVDLNLLYVKFCSFLSRICLATF